jgi:adenylate cyclase
MERRLAAILAADVVGYSRLIERDEAGTLAALRDRRRAILEPLVVLHRGRIVKLMGDGVLAEFVSAVNAVRCAVELQQKMTEANVGHDDQDAIVLRVGINLGDVAVEGEDLYGDGVNIAARLQSLAEPGEILIAGNVHDQVETKVAQRYEDLGFREIKNILRPIRVFRVNYTTQYPPIRPGSGAPAKPAIAVLPFTNRSADPEQEYFSDGISEDVITSLSKLSQLLVIARNSTFAYKGRSVKVQRIGQELGVQYVVEGSVRKAGERVRITAQLIDAASGAHLWADRFDRDLTDVFAVQDEVTREIVSALALQLTAEEQSRLVRRRIENMEAYDLFLRGREAWWRHTREASHAARALFERTIQLAPRFAPAYSFLSFTHNQDYVNGWTSSPERSQALGYDIARQAAALDASDPTAHAALGVAYLWRRQQDEAIAEATASIALGPNYSFGYMVLGWSLHYAGDQAGAIENLNKAIRLDPHHPGVYLHFLAQANFMLGQFEAAAALLKERLARDPGSDISRVLLAACHGHLGQVEQGRAEWMEALRVNPDYSLEHRRRVLPYKDPQAFERVVAGLRRAGVAE